MWYQKLIVLSEVTLKYNTASDTNFFGKRYTSSYSKSNTLVCILLSATICNLAYNCEEMMVV